MRALGLGELLTSDSFPGNGRNKLCLVSKARGGGVWLQFVWGANIRIWC